MKKINLLVLALSSIFVLAGCQGAADPAIDTSSSSSEEFEGPAIYVSFWRDYNQYSLVDDPYYKIRIERGSIIGEERKPANPTPVYEEWKTFKGWSTVPVYDDISKVTYWNFATDRTPNQMSLDLFGIWVE